MTDKATQNAIKAFKNVIYALEVARVMTEKSVAAEAWWRAAEAAVAPTACG